MKEVTFTGCNHTGEVEDDVKLTMGKVMDICPRCKAVSSPDELFVGYPCGYRMKYGKNVMALVKEIIGDQIIVATSQWQPDQLPYQEWTVAKSDFRKKGQMFTADPFGTVK